MRHYSNTYVFLFMFGVCVVCSMMISIAAVGLRERQQLNRQLDQQSSVLRAAHLIEPDAAVTEALIQEKFANIEAHVIEIPEGEETEVDPEEHSLKAAEMKPAPPGNPAGIAEMPARAEVFYVMKDGNVDTLILPVFGKGLWSTMYGYLALEEDTRTIVGITFYAHGETPGLGGEIENYKWQLTWVGRKAFDEDWEPQIELVKGGVGDPEDDPYHVDALSGATLTSRGVTNMLKFWLGEDGYGPYLEQFRKEHQSA